MTGLTLAWTDFGGDHDAPVLVLGPSLGTAVHTLWEQVARSLTDIRHVVGWDLPGHGEGSPASGFTLDDIADAVAEAVREATFDYAGDSAGGAVGLHLLITHPERVRTATLIATGARIGTPDGWRERAGLVRASGT
ncbi:MAG: alpha/beta fold hydrolase, partial [Nocardioides sp.]